MAFSLRHLTIRWLFVLIAGTTTIDAKTETAVNAEPIEFTVFARFRQKNLQFLPDDQGPPRSLLFFSNSRSPVYTFSGGRHLPFYAAKELTAYWEARTANPEQPPPLPKPIVVAVVPPGLTRVLILFIPFRSSDSGPLLLRTYVVDDNPHSLPAGYAAVINASGRTYQAMLGTEPLKVPLGIGGKVPAKGTVELRLAAQNRDGWTVCGRHTFKLGIHDRASLVFFPPASPTGIAPIIRTLVETTPSEKSSLLTSH